MAGSVALEHSNSRYLKNNCPQNTLSLLKLPQEQCISPNASNQKLGRDPLNLPRVSFGLGTYYEIHCFCVKLPGEFK